MKTYVTFATKEKSKFRKLLAIFIMFIAILLCFGINKSKVEATEPFGELYEINENYITKILPQTTVKDLKNNLELEDEEVLQVIDKDGVEKQDNEFIGTNMTLKLGEEEYKLSVVGDVNGDGKITITDVTRINLDQIGIKKIDKEYKISGDINGDGKITITDLVQVNLMSIKIKDKTAPVSFIPKVTVNDNTITVEGSTSDANSGVAEYYFKIDNGEWVQNEDKTKSTYTFKNIENAVHIIRMKVKDNAGNEKITEAVTISAVEGEINIYPSTTKWTNENITISVDYITDVGNTSKLISIDGGKNFVTYTRPIEIDKNTQIVAKLVSKEYGTIAQVSKQIQNIDKLAPQELNVDASANKQTITVNAIATDTRATDNYGESGIKEYKYTIRKDLYEWSKETEENTCEFSNLTKGETYIVQVTAIDNAGNEITSEEIEIKIGNLVALTVNTNGGTINGLGNTSQETGTSIELPEPSKDGYTFKEWKLTGDGSIEGNIYTYGKLPGTVTAVWEPITYIVEYNPNGATSGTTTNSIHTYDEAKELTQNGYQKEYTITYETNGAGTIENSTAEYTFAGWSIQANGQAQYEDKEEVTNLTTTNNSTVTLYAGWDNTSASITLPTLSKTGYVFKGWYEDDEYTNKAGNAGESYTPIDDITLYAKWEAKGDITYTVNHYKMNTSGVYETTPVETENKEGIAGNTVTIESLKKNYKGFTFAEAKENEATISSTTIVAYTSTEIDIYYSRNKYNYTLGTSNGVITTGSTASGEYYYEETITLRATTDVGYTWDKWESSNTSLVPNNTNQNTTITMPLGNITMTPKATINKYTLTFDANGGTVVEPSITKDYGESISLPTPIKEGYTFEGWYSDSSLLTKVGNASDKYTLSKNITLYAAWEGIYVKLYDDETLVFTSIDKTLAGKTLLSDYGDIQNEEFNEDRNKPWYNDREKITSVDIVDEIQPTSTAFWFERVRFVDNYK